ncbi:MAG: beta-N-acetylhexosaminidase [Acidimicrobiia bacterium]|nr:beta-N-acetylhexosaminidase [Acidimicrobiia bacterium]
MRSAYLLLLLALVATACSSVVTETTAASTTTTVTTVAQSTTTAAPTTTTTSTTTTTTTTLPRGTVAEDARAVVLAGLPGTGLDLATADFLAEGGRAVILFSKNLESRDQTRALTAAMACAADDDILVAVDQEPGRVDRLAKIGIPSPSIDSTRDDFIADTVEMGKAMFNLGINFDLAPVLDVARGSNPVLVGRNFGPDPEIVAARGLDFQLTLESFGIVTTAKHFPGHGLSTVDPHLQITPIDAGLETLQEVDFPPFQAAIDGGIGAVMVGHPIYEALDPDNPASLSPVVLDLLRTGFGFDGVAVTDAFSMAGVRDGRTLGEVTVEALIAGEDLLIVDNPPEVAEVVAVIEAAVADGTLSRDRLAEAAGRVRRLASEAAPVECEE